MIAIRVESVPNSYADTIRARRADEHGNTALVPQIAEADSNWPCRVCLQDAQAGEGVLLLSYAAIARPGPYRFVGPIFIHAEGCAPYADHARFPPMLERRLLSARAFDAEDNLVEAEVMKGDSLEPYVQRMFENPKVASVHVHTARNGCFLCRVERA